MNDPGKEMARLQNIQVWRCKRNLDFRYIKAREVRSFYDRVRLLKDSTVKLAVKAGIEFSFRMNMLTCKKAGVNELHLTKDVDKHIKSQTQTNSLTTNFFSISQF
jgi:hypothetical protein